MTKWIYSFEEGSANDKDLLGGKGANLAEMSRLGLPVPPGFTITTQSCINYLDNPDFFDSTLKEDVLKAVTRLEKKTEKTFSGENPNLLLVSVRIVEQIFHAWNDGYHSKSWPQRPTYSITSQTDQSRFCLQLLPSSTPDVRGCCLWH